MQLTEQLATALRARANAMYAKHGFAQRQKGQRYAVAQWAGMGPQAQLAGAIVASCYGVFYNHLGRRCVGQYLLVRYNGQLVPCYRLRHGRHYSNICQYLPVRAK